MPEYNQIQPKDFFISYHSADRLWAEWIVWQLEEEGYSVILQTGDAQLERSFVQEMLNTGNKAAHTIVVLSPDYLNSLYTQTEWADALRRDPTSEQGILLPVHVRECRDKLRGLLPFIAYIDLVGLDEQQSREVLLSAVRRIHGQSGVTPDLTGVTEHVVMEQPRFPGDFPFIWNVPYPRNPFFTGREELLTYLHDKLTSDTSMALTQAQAISGLGGIGKTQIAIEYTYRYRNNYQAVFWVTADSRERLVSDFLGIAHSLNLPEKDAQDQREIVQAVKRWLREHIDWLLIFDNADDIAMIVDFIPAAVKGHVLLTTRTQTFARIARGIPVETMTLEEGALFLLRRAHLIEPDAVLDTASNIDFKGAMQIANMMGGLPLALDQAAAYIEEVGCSIDDYLIRYQRHRKDLLSRRSALPSDHPEPVATTWALSFQEVEHANPAAAEMLRFCAFLSPDAIAEEIITQGAYELGPVLQVLADNPLAMDDAIAELRKYSLMSRNPQNKTLAVHRLVRAVLRDAMEQETQRQWARRVVIAVNLVFPEVKFENWSLCQRYLPQAQSCADLIDQWEMTIPEAVRLLRRAGFYLRERAQYSQAEALLLHALTIAERTFGPDHIQVAQTLNNLARLYVAQGKYTETEGLYKQALNIQEKVLGLEHPDTALTLYNLASLFQDEGRYEEAKALYQQALSIQENVLGTEHPDTTATLHNLAQLFQYQGRYEEAKALYQQALSIQEKVLGAEHPDTAITLHNLASLFQAEGRYEEAEALYQRALNILEHMLGPTHPDTAITLYNLASLFQAEGRYEEAEALYQQALNIQEKVLGAEHPDVASSLDSLANLYVTKGKYAEAAPLYLRAFEIYRQVLGEKHPRTTRILSNLAATYKSLGGDEEATASDDHVNEIQTERSQGKTEQ